MFRKRNSLSRTDKPDDERQIEQEAYVALRKSREEIARASGILAKEVRRLDEILSEQR